MKILKLHLVAFGGLSDVVLRFAPEQGLQVIYGPNEAGKSTALRALFGALYGIPERTSDAWLHATRDLRVAVQLSDEAGAVATFVRRKGRKETLSGENDQKVDEAQLARLLHGVSQQVFETFFRLDHRALVEGGNALAEGRGDLAQSLYYAGTGIQAVRDVQQRIEGEIGTLFKPRASAPLNDALSRYEAHKRSVRDLSVAPRAWKELSEQARGLREAIDRQTSDLATASKEIERCKRFRLALPKATIYRTAAARLQELQGVVLLEPGTAGDRQLAQQRLEQALEQARRSAEILDELQGRLSGIAVPEKLLRAGPAIEGLFARLESFRNARQDLPRVQARQQELERQAQELLAEIEPGLTIDQAARGLSAAQRAAFKRLSTEFTRLKQLLETTREQCTEAARKHARQMSRVDELGAPADPAPLQRGLAQAQADRNLEADLENALATAAAREHEARQGLAGLPLFSGTLEEAAALPVPGHETIELFEQQLARHDAAQAQLDEQLRQLRQEQSRIAARLQSLKLAGDVPTEEQLQQARRRRDQGWQLIRAAWIEGAAQAALAREYAGELPLASAYEQQVAMADQLADRLRREEGRVHELARLLADQADCQTRLEACEAEWRECRQEREACQNGWRAAWQPLKIDPRTPKEMRGWVQRLEALRGTLRELAAANQQAGRLRDLIARRKAGLADLLAAYGAPPVAPHTALVELLDLGQQLLERQQEAAGRAQADLAELDRLAAERDEAMERHLRAERDLDEWRDEWNRATREVIAHNTHPEEMLVLIERLEAAQTMSRQAREQEPRVASMSQHVEQFQSEALALVEAAAPDLRDLPADAAVTQLYGRLREARDRDGQRRHLEQQIADQQAQQQHAAHEAQAARQRIEQLMQQAGCATLEELEAAERRSDEVRGLMAQRDQAAQALLELAGGASLEQFLAELDMEDADLLPFRQQELQERQQQLERQRSDNQVALGAVTQQLSFMDGTSRALAAAEEAESALAEARRYAERAARLTLAAGVLRRYLDWYRQRNQSPVLARASLHFRRLTCGSFAGVEVVYDDDDQPRLVGLRPDRREVPVEGLSEGSRDQLFLALRLASLERQIEAGARLPWVVDDILVNFDDGRAAATLELLAELSRVTQILFFTHHRRLVELARDRLNGAGVEIHELA